MSSSDPILLLTGPPGAGKTTVARYLGVRHPRSVHLESDHFFRFIAGGFVEPWRPEAHDQNTAVMDIVATAALGYATAGYFTIVDGILIPGWFFEPLRDAVSARGMQAAFVVLRAPVEVCVERCRSRIEQGFEEPAAIERLWRSFSSLGAFEPHVIDTGEADPRVVAQVIERNLERFLVSPG